VSRVLIARLGKTYSLSVLTVIIESVVAGLGLELANIQASHASDSNDDLTDAHPTYVLRSGCCLQGIEQLDSLLDFFASSSTLSRNEHKSPPTFHSRPGKIKMKDLGRLMPGRARCVPIDHQSERSILANPTGTVSSKASMWRTKGGISDWFWSPPLIG
jgi:hypothetical protein